MAKKPDIDEGTLQTMAALVRTPPKPHDQMKLGKPKGKSKKSLAKLKEKKPGK
jgi:hypothetical protein